MTEQTTERRGDHELRRRLGISRRDLLRRGAVVGGTLVWTVPVIESISRNALAAKGSPASVCCACKPKGSKTWVCVTGSALASADTDKQCKAYCKQHFGSSKHTYLTGPP